MTIFLDIMNYESALLVQKLQHYIVGLANGWIMHSGGICTRRVCFQRGYPVNFLNMLWTIRYQLTIIAIQQSHSLTNMLSKQLLFMCCDYKKDRDRQAELYFELLCLKDMVSYASATTLSQKYNPT